MILDLLVSACFIRIAVHDIKTQKIRNSDLLATGFMLSFIHWRNWLISLLNFTIYTVLYILSNRKLGEGDLKLSLICALPLASFEQLTQAIGVTWFTGGIFALIKPKTSIAFAPFMILGTYFVKFFLPYG
jgi:Flp pilus assembly protein protease CpaA